MPKFRIFGPIFSGKSASEFRHNLKNFTHDNVLHVGLFFIFFFVVCRYLSKLTFPKKSFNNIIRVSNSLDPDQAQSFVRLDLGPKCLQSSSADYKIRRKEIVSSSTSLTRKHTYTHKTTKTHNNIISVIHYTQLLHLDSLE